MTRYVLAALLGLALVAALFFLFRCPLAQLVDDTDSKIAVYTLWLTICTALLCIATALLVVVAYAQQHDTRLHNRAEIGVEPHGLRPWRGRASQFLGHVGITNAGILSARKLKWLLLVEMTNDGDRTDFPISGDLRGEQVVLGRSVMLRGTRPIAMTGEDYCFVWGIVQYDDGYGKIRKTRFCHRYNCRRDDFRNSLIIEAVDARQHEYGNSTT